MENVTIRLATVDDAPAINAVYNHYVFHSSCTFQLEPETDDARRAWLQAHGPRHPVIVAEERGKVIAWGSLSKFRDRAAYDHTVEASVYVGHDHLGRGLGRVLLIDLIARAKQLGHHTLIGGATAEQTASVRLQESLGFQRIGVFREVGHKFGRYLDVVFMQLLL